MGELARTCSGPECFLCTTQIEDDPLNAVYESQQNQWGGLRPFNYLGSCGTLKER